MAKVRWYYKNV